MLGVVTLLGLGSAGVASAQNTPPADLAAAWTTVTTQIGFTPYDLAVKLIEEFSAIYMWALVLSAAFFVVWAAFRLMRRSSAKAAV